MCRDCLSKQDTGMSRRCILCKNYTGLLFFVGIFVTMKKSHENLETLSEGNGGL